MGLFESGTERRQRQAAVDSLYSQAVAIAREPGFYQWGAVPDTVDGRFDLLVLHMFLLLHRLGQEGPAMKTMTQGLFDLMFLDMDRSLREMGVSDMSVGKRVKEMARAFYGRIDAYEPALKDSAKLEEALARNLYRGQSVAPSSLAAMTAYVQRQAAHLEALASPALLSESCFQPAKAP